MILAAFLLDERAERIVRVFGLYRFKRFRARFFVRVERYVNTVWQVVAVKGHALQVLISIDQNSDLRIVTITEIEIGNAASNFDCSVFLDRRMSVGGQIVPIANQETTGIHRSRILKTLFETLHTVFANATLVIFDRMNVLEVVNVLMLGTWRTNDLYVCLFTRVSDLRNTASVHGISLSLQNL